jgi:hypothetical protein
MPVPPQTAQETHAEGWAAFPSLTPNEPADQNGESLMAQDQENPQTSAYAELLNRLSEMQQAAYYSTARATLAQAEATILRLEQENVARAAVPEALPNVRTVEAAQTFMVFDVESIGLHGEGFAVGYVVVNRAGETLDQGLVACDPLRAQGDLKNLAWVQENVPAFECGCFSTYEVREEFWSAWMRWKGRGAVLVADCAWPVEARFLALCVDDAKISREWEGPYPLHDLASVMLALGKDPLATNDRLPSELPAHHPLNDARQSARLLVEALTSASVAVPEALPVATKYDDVLMPFLSLMRKELHANCGKGDRPGWLAISPGDALLEVYYHLAKLQKAVRKNDGPAIQEYAADVANMSMMVLDICGGLAILDFAAPVAAPAAEAQTLEPSDEQLSEMFAPHSGGPNPYRKCRICGGTEPSVRNVLVDHWATHVASSAPSRSPMVMLTEEETVACLRDGMGDEKLEPMPEDFKVAEAIQRAFAAKNGAAVKGEQE